MKTGTEKQGSYEWLQARAGIPTASEFDNIFTLEFKPRTGSGLETYLCRKLAEKIIGGPLQAGGGAQSFYMEQGAMMESEALPWYEFTHGVTIQRAGLVTTDDGRVGCSPDGLIGEDGGIECKCPAPDTHLKYLLGGGVPKDYLPQVHGSLYVTGRKWWKFLSYSRKFPPLIVHVERDEDIMGKIKSALDAFLKTFDEKLEILNAMKTKDAS